MVLKHEPIDEKQWFDPIAFEQQFGGILHSNNVHYYFANSPFFDPTSNNAILIGQGHRNPQFGQQVLATRELFEARLRSMSGLEYMVSEAPKDPMWGTGVWVINKQTRTKVPGDPDGEVTVNATYFLVGIHIYQAPTLGDILASRVAAMSYHLSKTISPAAQAIKWTPATGHFYHRPEPQQGSSQQQQDKPRRMDQTYGALAKPPAAQDSMPDPLTTSATAGISDPPSRFIEETLATHMRYGGEYMDENPILGQPGSFHLASTGRVDPKPMGGKNGSNLPLLGPITTSGVSGLGTLGGAGKKGTDGKDKEASATAVGSGGGTGSAAKTPKTPGGGAPKAKRRKSTKITTSAQ
ncbi:uncharacterized protein MKZ38_000849 [Zalerion maritima]|uniref:Mediator of RNA polymerase II transcription subunit 6 n=1 Tax=Zalerion maritima TaxID=339359 RepID=A0AAD5WVM5_9PEZI|nr:uncharacterized protein MKZ38_000849 [Zalerion maritima]